MSPASFHSPQSLFSFRCRLFSEIDWGEHNDAQAERQRTAERIDDWILFYSSSSSFLSFNAHASRRSMMVMMKQPTKWKGSGALFCLLVFASKLR